MYFLNVQSSLVQLSTAKVCESGGKEFVKYIRSKNIRSTRQRGQVGQSIAVMSHNLPSLLVGPFAGQAVVTLFLFLVNPMSYTNNDLKAHMVRCQVMKDNWRVF